MEISEETKLLNAAIAKAQSKIKTPAKTKKVDFTHEGKRTHYFYADLADTIDACREPLAENGLSIVHQIQLGDNGSYGLKTTLFHSGGGFISTFYPLPDPSKIKPQAFGSALTYARRYSYSSLIGIASEDDDDGANAEGPAKPPTPPSGPKNKSSSPAQGSFVTEPQLKRLFAISNKQGWTHDEIKLYIAAAFQLETTKDLDRNKYETLINVIEGASFSHAMEEFGHPVSKVEEELFGHPPDEPPKTLIDQLVEFVELNGVAHDDVRKAILKATNTNKKSTELTTDELNSVLKYLKLTKSKTPNVT